ncbi:MAG TPA: toxin-antitoxin system HicB family antitoxin [Gaiellaceae bacterium]|nr:toxin-antitoxin system HicB family antitoxin [Gaiellaceae bacterium]
MVGAPSTAVQPEQERRISLVRVTDGGPDEWLAEVEDFPQLSARAPSPEEAARRAWAAIEASSERPLADGSGRSPSHSGKLLVRMPATLHDELARAAEREGVSLNQLITGVLASSVAWRSAARADAEAVDRSRNLTRTVLAANFAVVVLAALVALALLLTAWLD